MAQVLVRKLDDAVKDRLVERAAKHGRSLEAEVRAILQDAAKEGVGGREGLGSRVAARFSNREFPETIEELRGSAPRPAEFDL